MHLSTLGIGLKILLSFNALEPLNSSREDLVSFISIVRNLQLRIFMFCWPGILV